MYATFNRTVQERPKLVDVYAVLFGNPTQYPVTAYALFTVIFRVSGLVQVDSEVLGWKKTCQLGRFEGITAVMKILKLTEEWDLGKWFLCR